MSGDNKQTSIDDRLLNWARWATARGRRGADCMTGAICESLRRAALGDVWSGHEVRNQLDNDDAVLLERNMRKLIKPKRDLLKLYYVDGTRWQIICRRVRIRVDKELFGQRLCAAQNAIESVVDNGGRER
jgi:hypothetical protein